MADSSNPFQEFLQVDVDPGKPDFGKVFGINSKSTAEEIQKAADRTIQKLKSVDPAQRSKEWKSLLELLTRAKAKLVQRHKNLQKGQPAGTRNKAEASPTAKPKTKAQPSVSQPPAYAPPASQPPTLTAETGKVAKKGGQEKSATKTPVGKQFANDDGNSKKESAKSGSNMNSPVTDESPRSTGKSGDDPNAQPASEKPGEDVGLPKPATKRKEVGGKKSQERTDRDDLSFTLDAPDVQDSFDADTNLSTNSFPTSSVTAPTVDPLAPVDDLSSAWHEVDLSSVPEQMPFAPFQFSAGPDDGNSGGGTAVAMPPAAKPVSHVAIKSTSPANVATNQSTSQSETAPAVDTGLGAKENPSSPTASSPVDPTSSVKPLVSEKTFYSKTYRAKSKTGLMIGGTLLAIVIVGAVSYVAIFGFGSSDADQAGDKQTAQNGETSKKDEGQKSGDASKGGEDESTATGNGQANSNTSDADNQTGGRIGASSAMSPGSKGPDSPQSMNPSETDPDSEDPNMANPGTDDPTPDDPNPDTPKTNPDPANAEPETPEPVQPKNSEIAELAKLLPSIQSKLLDRDFVEANRLLAMAETLPKLPDHAEMLKRLTLVKEAYVKFWNKVVEGCGMLKGTDELEFSSTNIVVVVESSEEKIVYRALGQRFEKEPRELPIGIAMKIAEKAMDVEDPQTRVVKGAVYAIESLEDEVRADQARTMWEEAKLIGADTDELMLYLADDYDLVSGAIEKVAVPDEAAFKAAQEAFRKKYESELRKAGRNAQAALEFSEALLSAAPLVDDAAEKYAHFKVALFYAAKSGEVPKLLGVIDEMAKWYNVKSEDEVYEGLAQMNKGRLKPDAKREIARTAFEYMDRAKARNDSDQELKFAELALAAARGTRDPRLIQTATGEVARIKASMNMN